MFKNVSIKKVIVLGVLAISTGYGMERERAPYHSPISSRLTTRVNLNLENVDSGNSVNRVLDFNRDINMDFSEDSSDDSSYRPSNNSLDVSSYQFSMDEDNVITENRPPVQRNLAFELAGVVGQGDVFFGNILNGFDGDLQNYLNAELGEGDDLTYEMYMNVNIPNADRIIDINSEADTESDDEEESICAARAA